MEIRTLKEVSLPEMSAAFNAGFEDYILPLHVTEEQMQDRITTESIDMALSVGMFDNNRLVGFILTAINTVDGILIANNSGTGVAKEYRGRGITVELYSYLLLLLKKQGVKRCTLEVIKENAVARHIYEKIGYRMRRELESYKADGPVKGTSDIAYRLTDSSPAAWTSFCDVTSSWQYSLTAIDKTASKKTVEIVEEGSVVAAAILKPANGRVLLFGVDKAHRRKGIGTALFNAMSRESAAPLMVINVDSIQPGIHSFLQNIGMKPFLSQYEMMMDI